MLKKVFLRISLSLSLSLCVCVLLTPYLSAEPPVLHLKILELMLFLSTPC